MPHSFEEVCGAVARGWCAPANLGKEMDSDLATAIAKEVWMMLHPWAVTGGPQHRGDDIKPTT
jgi:hypothetical protein